MLDRVYGSTLPDRFKDGTSIMLLPGESPRKPYRYEDVTDHCPHCGARTGYVHTATYFGCPCGTHLFAEVVPVMPLTPDMVRTEEFVQAGGNPLVGRVCEKCGAEYKTYARRPAKWCTKCRQARYRRNYKKRLREAQV